MILIATVVVRPERQGWRLMKPSQELVSCQGRPESTDGGLAKIGKRGATRGLGSWWSRVHERAAAQTSYGRGLCRSRKKGQRRRGS